MINITVSHTSKHRFIPSKNTTQLEIQRKSNKKDKQTKITFFCKNRNNTYGQHMGLLTCMKIWWVKQSQ